MEEEKEKKAAQGIGTLIIFIAMILVAAVAAGVLIQTAASLQSKSLDVGRQSQEKISTDIDIAQVSVYDTSDGEITGGVDNFSISMRLGSGSTPVKFLDTLIKLDTAAAANTMNYRYGATASETTYSVTYLLNGSNHIDGYLVNGDSALITLTIASGANITENSRVSLRVIPRNGAIKPIDMHMPSATVEPVTYLYP